MTFAVKLFYSGQDLSRRPRPSSTSPGVGLACPTGLRAKPYVVWRAAVKVERNWLLHGMGEVEGESPFVEDPELSFVAVPHVELRPSMGGGTHVEMEPQNGRPYHFQKAWIRYELRSKPGDLRIMHVEGDSMMPTLHDDDIVLIDVGRRSPTPPGIFVLHDGMGLVAKRLEHIPNSDPPRVRIISDNPIYSPYEAVADEINIIGRIRWFAREI